MWALLWLEVVPRDSAVRHAWIWDKITPPEPRALVGAGDDVGARAAARGRMLKSLEATQPLVRSLECVRGRLSKVIRWALSAYRSVGHAAFSWQGPPAVDGIICEIAQHGVALHDVA